MSLLRRFKAPGADRRWSLFTLKRIVLEPVVRARRRRHADESADVRRRFENHAYSRDSALWFHATVIDPKVLHRADLDASSVVIDVGAGDGSETADFVELYGATVYAFEPQPGAHALLVARFRDEPRVKVFPYGLGAADAVVTMELAGDASSVYGSNRGEFETTEVQIRDIAAVLDELGLARVDLIKINIEGAEYDLLDRLVESGLVGRFRYVLVQFHEWHRRAYLRRWRLRRALRATHDEVWGYDWIWEQWCLTSDPDPSLTRSAAETEAIVAAIRRGEHRTAASQPSE